MNKADVEPAGVSQREVVLIRTFDAPLGLMWKAWTDAEHLARWWGPTFFVTTVVELDLRPCGAFQLVMRLPDGSTYPMKGEFTEIVEHERLVFKALAEDADGTPSLDVLTIVTFEAQGGKTKLTVQAKAVGLVPRAGQMMDGMELGWSQSLERLGTLVGELKSA